MLGSVGGSSALLSSIQNNQSKLLTYFQQLSSGKSINSAADDPAGMAQSTSYQVQLSSQAQAMSGVQNNMSLLDTASGGMSQISDGLQQLNALAVQAGNGSLNANDLQSIQDQMSQLTQGIDQIARNTQFNGQNLLDGSFSSSLQSSGVSVALPNLSSAALGISGLDISSSSGQANAVSAINNALDLVNSQQASAGSVSAGLDAELSNLSDSYTNLSAANSSVSDTDFIKVISDMAQKTAQQQASIKALAIYNKIQKNTLSLISNNANS